MAFRGRPVFRVIVNNVTHWHAAPSYSQTTPSGVSRCTKELSRV
jgi:hypothetical protein